MNATKRHGPDDSNESVGMLQLRVVVEVDDFDAAVAFYRDHLGMPQEFLVDSGDGARVVALQAGRATLELVTAEQRRLIDRLEVGRDVSPRIRVAFEVAEVDTATARMIDAGAELVAPPTETPWSSLNARLDGPGPIHLTLFQELDERPQP
jgi:catechol 2,3-dioxygenase-like lactoylglutathione lyase family enzyme